jgi:hypothetical protein
MKIFHFDVVSTRSRRLPRRNRKQRLPRRVEGELEREERKAIGGDCGGIIDGLEADVEVWASGTNEDEEDDALRDPGPYGFDQPMLSNGQVPANDHLG